MKVIITGSFDPITLGHMEIIDYASKKYDEVYVVALVNENKRYMFSLPEKRKFIEDSVSEYKNVIADAYEGLTADYMHKNGIKHIIRGIRNENDKKYETILAEKMKEFDSEFETEFILSSLKTAHISSNLVREKIANGEDISNLVPKAIEKSIIEAYKK